MDLKQPPDALGSDQLFSNPSQTGQHNPTDSNYHAKQYSISDDQESDVRCPPPCKCVDCADSWYTTKRQSSSLLFQYWAQLDDDAAAKTIMKLLEGINLALKRLCQVLERRGDSLMSKWKKKSKKHRATLIKSVAPHIAEDHSSLFNLEYSRRGPWLLGDELKKRHATRWMLLLPWLTLDTLSANPAALFALAHFRSSCSSAEWAAWDNRQLDLGWDSGHFDHGFSPKCVAMYEPCFGQVVSWNAAQAHCGLILGYPRARLVLEAQSNLSQFLVNLITIILGDTELHRELRPPSQDRWIGAAEAGFRRTTGTTELWSGFVSQTFSERNEYTHQAFGPAPSLDLQHLCDLATTRKKAIEDHLYDLQTDIYYMRHHLNALKNSTLLRYAPEAAGVILSTYISFLIQSRQQWHLLEEECRHTKAKWNKIDADIAPGQPLPEDLNRALDSLELLCINTVILHCKRLQEQTPFFPGSVHAEEAKFTLEEAFRNKSRSAVNHPRHWKNLQTQMVFERIRDLHFQADPLDWCLNELLFWPDTMASLGHNRLFTFLEYFLCENEGEANRLDDVIMHQLSDLAAAHEMLFAVRHQRPRNTTPEVKEFESREDRIIWRTREQSKGMAITLTVPITLACQDLWDEFLIAGADDVVRPSQMLEHTRRLRKALELFWLVFRRHAEVQYGNGTLNQSQMDAMLASISVVGSAEYVALIQGQENATMRPMRRSKSGLFLSQLQLSHPSSDWSKETLQDTRQTKQKTQPEQQKQAETALVADAEVGDTATNQEKIQVHKQHLAIFDRMFPQSTEEKAPKTKWPAFVDAMYAAGCAVQNGGGSAVSFEDKVLAKGKVVLHKGYPDSDIDQNTMQVFGRRFKKRFGWSRDCFVAKE